MTVRAGLPLFTTPTRASTVERRSKRPPSQRISALAPGYRAAAEALEIAAANGCSEPLYEALWRLCLREHDRWLAGQARQEGNA